MRKLVFVGLLFAGAVLASVGTSDPASASWCYRGYGYGYGYAPAYGYGYSPWALPLLLSTKILWCGLLSSPRLWLGRLGLARLGMGRAALGLAAMVGSHRLSLSQCRWRPLAC